MTRAKKVPPEWTGSTSSYSESSFYIHAADEHGHIAQMHPALLPSLSAWIKQIVERPDSPYRNKEDFARDAMYHRAVWWESKLGTTSELLMTSLALERLATMTREMKQKADLVSKYEEGLALAAETKNWNVFQSILTDAKKTLRDPMFQDPYRSQLAKTVRDAAKKKPKKP